MNKHCIVQETIDEVFEFVSKTKGLKTNGRGCSATMTYLKKLAIKKIMEKI